ncbi:hypothetical protein Tco_1487700, partial [Tanacetum coccineum]
GAEDVDSEETDEESLVRRPTGIVIGGEGSRESDEEEVDQSKKLKGLETLSEASQFKLNMKKAKKASRHAFIIQQRPRGSCEGSGVTPEVPDELTLKSSNEGVGVIPEVLDELSDYSSSSNSDSEFAIKDISSDEDEVTEKADDVKKADVEKDTDEQVAKEQIAEKQTRDKEHDVDCGDNKPSGDA